MSCQYDLGDDERDDAVDMSPIGPQAELGDVRFFAALRSEAEALCSM